MSAPPPRPLLDPPPGFVPGAPLHAIPTNWAAVKGIDEPDAPDRDAKWAYVVRVYREPMERYAERILRRALGTLATPEDTEDCVAAFLASCVQTPTLSEANPGIAPFRAFLQDRLGKFAKNFARAALAKKRRPSDGATLVSVDAIKESGAEPPAPDEADRFDEAWVEALYGRALERLRTEPRRARYATIVDSLRRGTDLPDVTPNDRSRARHAFSEAFRATVLETLPHPAFELEEWQALERFLPTARG